MQNRRWIDSVLRQGWAKMPALDDEQGMLEGAIERQPLLHSQRVLIADDDATFVQLAELALAPIAGRVDSAEDGAGALGQLIEQVYDLAILDLSMPRADGFKLLTFIRQSTALKHLPVVVITARDDVEAAQEVYRLGADLMLVKPISWAVFPYQVSGAIRARSRNAEFA